MTLKESLGLKNKNILKFYGKPLIYWTYQEIKKTKKEMHLRKQKLQNY